MAPNTFSPSPSPLISLSHTHTHTHTERERERERQPLKMGSNLTNLIKRRNILVISSQVTEEEITGIIALQS